MTFWPTRKSDPKYPNPYCGRRRDLAGAAARGGYSADFGEGVEQLALWDCVTGAQLASYKLTRCWGGASGAVAVACDGGDASARKARRGQRRAARRALKEMEAAAKARAADRRAGGGASKATGWGGQRSGGGGSGGVGGGGGLLAAAGTAASRSLVHAGG